MKVYTIKDLESFERDENGYLICPSGDYTQIRVFGANCIFSANSVFGDNCGFGERSKFGERCRFGDDCGFGECCTFGRRCSFSKNCSFGEWCSFGECSSFGKNCTFGERCNLENNLKFENIKDKVERVLKIDRIGSRKGCTYFFKTLNEIYVRCGCFFGTIAEFENKVNKTHKYNEQYQKEYIGAINYAKAILI